MDHSSTLSHLITIEYTSTDLFTLTDNPRAIGSRSISVDNATYAKILEGDELYIDGDGPLDPEHGRIIEYWVFNHPHPGWASFVWEVEKQGTSVSYEPLRLWHDGIEKELPNL